MAKAIDVADADFAIVNAEIQYERARRSGLEAVRS